MKLSAHLSYRVAILRQFLRRANMFSIHCLAGHAFMPEKVMARFAKSGVKRDGDLSVLPRGNAGLNITCYRRVAKPVGIIAPVRCPATVCLKTVKGCQQRPGLWERRYPQPSNSGSAVRPDAYTPPASTRLINSAPTLGIEHRLAPPQRPQTNGMAPLMVCLQTIAGQRSVSMAGSKRCCKATTSVPAKNWKPRCTATRCSTTSYCRSQPWATGPPLQAMKEWHKRKPDLFKKLPYHLPGCDK